MLVFAPGLFSDDKPAPWNHLVWIVFLFESPRQSILQVFALCGLDHREQKVSFYKSWGGRRTAGSNEPLIAFGKYLHFFWKSVS